MYQPNDEILAAVKAKFADYVNSRIDLTSLYHFVWIDVDVANIDNPAWLPTKTHEEIQNGQRVQVWDEKPKVVEVVSQFVLRVWEYQDFPSLGEDHVLSFCREALDE